LREEHFNFGGTGAKQSAAAELDLRTQVGDLERRLIRRSLDAASGNQTRAAEMLGISRFGLQKMLKRLGVSVK
jgi:DNA-binding protein Fis